MCFLVSDSSSFSARAARYARSFSLPADIDQGQSEARFENGVLTLKLAKRVAENGGLLTVL